MQIDRLDREMHRPRARLRHVHVVCETWLIRIGSRLLDAGCWLGVHWWSPMPGSRESRWCIHCRQVA